MYSCTRWVPPTNLPTPRSQPTHSHHTWSRGCRAVGEARVAGLEGEVARIQEVVRFRELHGSPGGTWGSSDPVTARELSIPSRKPRITRFQPRLRSAVALRRAARPGSRPGVRTVRGRSWRPSRTPPPSSATRQGFPGCRDASLVIVWGRSARCHFAQRSAGRVEPRHPRFQRVKVENRRSRTYGHRGGESP
jgi:hypothetical protein